MKKVKVLYFMDGIGNAGGIQEMVINWVKNFDQNKITVDILSYDTGKADNYTERFETFGGKVYIIPTFTRKHQFFKSLKATKDFFKNHSDYDIIHAHASSKAYFVLREAKRCNINVRILHSHCTQFVNNSFFSKLIGNLLKPFSNLLANNYFGCSHEAGEFLFGKRRMLKKGVIIPNGIETTSFKFSNEKNLKKREELNLGDKIIIGNVGRFRPQKNHEFLIDVFKKVHEENANTILVLVGNGELFNQIKNKVQKLDLENHVLFLGYRSDVFEIMQTFNVFVMTSLFEGLPVTGVEAQALGIPCVFSSNISKDVMIIPKVEFIGLNEPKNKWSERILYLANSEKVKNPMQYLLDRKYDIKLSSNYLVDLYFKLLKGE